MFCMNCGAELNGNMKFCTKCGAPVIAEDCVNNSEATEFINIDANNEVETLAKVKAGSSIVKPLVIGLLTLLTIGLVGTLAYLFGPSMFDKSDKSSVEKNYKKAEKLLDDGEYDDAIGYFKKIIKEDPEFVDAYIGAAQAYVEMDKMDDAIDILVDGYKETNDKDILKLLKKCLEKVGKTIDDIALDNIDSASAGDDTQDGEAVTEGDDTDTEVYQGVQTTVDINVRQVDTSDFPNVVLYTSIVDENGESVADIKKSDLDITEIDINGNISDVTINDVYQVIAKNEKINVNLILDASGSMSGNKMSQAKNAANALLDHMNLDRGDAVEIISFDDYVYLQQEFTSNRSLLSNAIDNIYTGDMTALYDAIYSGLYQTYYEDGAKCVIAFTDGAENASSYSFDDVVDLAQNSGIPVYIIGIGDEGYDHSALQSLASACSGMYYSVNDSDIQSILEEIYISIYEEQQDYYVVKYTSTDNDNLGEFRDVRVETSPSAPIVGSFTKSYVPEADIYGAFSSEYMNKDYIFDDSSYRELTYSDLEGLSLAELRIARNEIFARHGRQFKDPFLNQWFYSKAWYLNIPNKYSPDYYDNARPDPLTSIESKNVSFIKSYEDNIVANEDIYPNARMVLLTEYDLALSKATLRVALSQLERYASTDTLEENKRLIQEAIDREDVHY